MNEKPNTVGLAGIDYHGIESEACLVNALPASRYKECRKIGPKLRHLLTLE